MYVLYVPVFCLGGYVYLRGVFVLLCKTCKERGSRRGLLKLPVLYVEVRLSFNGFMYVSVLKTVLAVPLHYIQVLTCIRARFKFNFCTHEGTLCVSVIL